MMDLVDNRRELGMHVRDGLTSFSVTDLALDVSAAVPVDEPCLVSGSLFVPDELPEHPVIVFAIPGGTYRRHYFDLQPPGRSGFSQARYFAERGVIFAAMDYLGGGDSSRPADGDKLTLPVLADAAHDAFLGLRAGLHDGRFGVGPIDRAIFAGLGFSFGGGVMIIEQGKHADFDAMLIYGYSPIAADNHEGHDIPDDWDELSEAERRELIRANNAAIAGGELPVYHGVSRFSAAWQAHYLPDTDRDLILYDEEQIQTLVPRMAGVDVMTHGFALPFARRIECPVFVAFADQDMVASPHQQPAAYPSSNDVTLAVIPRSRHLVNFCDSRYQLWDRTLTWLRDLGELTAG
jgi:pimeloyl-ACP methyl ester carboxylesterase